ncbi:unnamed protein product [Mesocestoides corti]|uniref:BTB domain-containing protein n=1 Tax=Mesocestoides corti TaxID=53468 RepID=A0A158QTZ8_MESCO|nr:unnamed protein product [Mesocestoides corti]
MINCDALFSTITTDDQPSTPPSVNIDVSQNTFPKDTFPRGHNIKQTRFITQSSETFASHEQGANQDEPRDLLKPPPPASGGKANLSKFSCCAVAYPDDPVEDHVTLPSTTKTGAKETNQEGGGPVVGNFRGLSSCFTSLSRYGYDRKHTGPLLKLNISGTPFIVKVSTLRRDPMVFEKILEDAEYISDTDEYYMERDPVVFRFVHAYLRYQEMHLPLNICGPLLERELEAWGLQLGFDLQRCCLGPVMDTKSKLESLKKFEEAFTETSAVYKFRCQISKRWQTFCENVWRVITDTPKKRWLATSSTGSALSKDNCTETLQDEGILTLDSYLVNGATVPSGAPTHPMDGEEAENGGSETGDRFSSNRPFNWRSLQKTPKVIIFSRLYVAGQALVVMSLIIYMVIAYVPSLREPLGPPMNAKLNESDMGTYGTFPVSRSYATFDTEQRQATQPVLAIRVLTWICVILFTLDLIARAIFCPHFFRWLLSIYTITDIISLIPFYVEGIIFALIEQMSPSPETTAKVQKLFYITDLINVLKIFVIGRLFRLLQRQRSTRVLIYTIRTASVNMFMVFELMVLCAIFFGTTIFFFDQGISSVFVGIWWAFTTMTTVGYGDVTPSSVPGRVIAVLCMIAGILLTSYTVPVLVNDFLLFYGHADQLAWMRRVHRTATAKRRNERRDLMAKRRITRVRALLKNAVIGVGTALDGEGTNRGSGGDYGFKAGQMFHRNGLTLGHTKFRDSPSK